MWHYMVITDLILDVAVLHFHLESQLVEHFFPWVLEFLLCRFRSCSCICKCVAVGFLKFLTILGQPSGADGICTNLVMLGLALRYCAFKLLKFLLSKHWKADTSHMFRMFQSNVLQLCLCGCFENSQGSNEIMQKKCLNKNKVIWSCIDLDFFVTYKCWKSTHRMEYEYAMGNCGHRIRLEPSCNCQELWNSHCIWTYVYYKNAIRQIEAQNQKYHMCMSLQHFNGGHEGTVWDSKNKYEIQKQISRHAANVESSRTHAQPIDKCHSSDVYVHSFQEPMQCSEAHIFQRRLHIEKNHDWTC